MVILTLLRSKFTKKSTIGTLRISGKEFTTLENPWLDNQTSISCIPIGMYDIVRRNYGGYYNRYSKKFEHRCVFEIINVIDRTNILIHIGNYPKNTKGCVLVGKTKGKDFIGKSTDAYREVYDLLYALTDDVLGTKNAQVRLNILNDNTN